MSEEHDTQFDRTGGAEKTGAADDEFSGFGFLDRRTFLKSMWGAALIMAEAACTRQPEERILPYVHLPEYITPGEPLYYATCLLSDGFAQGVLVESRMGRPLKIEGHPSHPASLGGSTSWMQAAIYDLYDPERSASVRQGKESRSWAEAKEAILARSSLHRAKNGTGLAVLSLPDASPSLGDLRTEFRRVFPYAQWLEYQPLSFLPQFPSEDPNRPLLPVYDFSQAETVILLESDIFALGPSSAGFARTFFRGRKITASAPLPSKRLFAAESTPTVSGSLADARLPIRCSRIPLLAETLLARIREQPSPAVLSATEEAWMSAVFSAVKSSGPRTVIIGGNGLPAALHGTVHEIHHALGSYGKALRLVPHPAPNEGVTGLSRLCSALSDGEIESLFVLGGNPAYQSPAPLRVDECIRRAEFSLHLALYEDETSACCSWHLPQAHSLESWGDACSVDGTFSLIQPLIAPLYGGRTALEILHLLVAGEERSAHELVHEFWTQRFRTAGVGDSSDAWQRALESGSVELPSASFVSAETAPTFPPRAANNNPSSDELELVLIPDYAVLDGRFSNNAWLQEVPRPFSTLTWENAAILSPATAQQYGLQNDDQIALTGNGARIEVPVWIVPGTADRSIHLSFGYGRSAGGTKGLARGVNAYTLWSTDGIFALSGVSLEKLPGRAALAATQGHQRMEGRQPIKSGTAKELFAKKKKSSPLLSHYPEPAATGQAADGYAWGMSIDLNSCTGCNACVVACQVENNIPVVGPEQVRAGREMHWIRIDHYYSGPDENPQIFHQPVPCMHCEHAPCELVCPVGATVHSAEGLNEMVYNRCIGTRYCSNNCPYKVRRFNFYHYTDYQTPQEKMRQNPDVTVRFRGVMEKCTYCVQRINAGRITAEKEGRTIRDGEVRTACQAACPSEAIVFGNINDPQSAVSRQKAEPHTYALLEELNTRPRTTYLARVSRESSPDSEESI
jgi:molybdopterin-containing oxidoreductase family iron-sulfur binding subunit